MDYRLRNRLLLKTAISDGGIGVTRAADSSDEGVAHDT